MKLDIINAIKTHFYDEKWYLKLILPTIIITLGMIFKDAFKNNFLLSAISYIPVIFVFGFYIQFMHNEINDKRPILPELKIYDYFKSGFFGSIIIFLYIVIMLLLFVIISSILAGLSILFKNMLIIGLLAIILNIPIFLLSISLGFSLSAYAETLSFTEKIDFLNTFRLMSIIKFEIFIFVLVSFFITASVDLLFKNIRFIISPFIIVILQLILFGSMAQLYKIARNRLENKNIISQGT